MKKLLLVFMFCSAIISGYAQNDNNTTTTATATTTIPKNYIKLYAGDFAIKKSVHYGSPIAQMGLYYERHITKQLYGGIGFSKWTPILMKGEQVLNVREVPDPSRDPNRTDGLQTRRSMSMIDLYAYHKFHIRNTNHYFNLGGAISYAWAIEEHYKKNDANANPYWVQYEEKVGKYWGFVPAFAYDYLFLNDLLNAGVDVRARIYRDYPKTQYDLGIHVGVNF